MLLEYESCCGLRLKMGAPRLVISRLRSLDRAKTGHTCKVTVITRSEGCGEPLALLFMAGILVPNLTFKPQ